MANIMNDDYVVADFIRHPIRIRRNNQAANGRIVRAPTNEGMERQKIDKGLNAGLNARRATLRARPDEIKNLIEIGERRKGIANLQR